MWILSGFWNYQILWDFIIIPISEQKFSLFFYVDKS